MDKGKSKKRRILVICLIALGICTITSAAVLLVRLQSFSSTGVLVEYSSEPAWYESGIDKSGGTEIIIYNDGTAEMRSTPAVVREGKEIPAVSFTVDSEDVAKIQKAIRLSGFIFSWGNVSTDSCDGSYVHITVHTQMITHTSGGLNPDNIQFNYVRDAIWNVIPEKVTDEYDAEEEAYFAD